MPASAVYDSAVDTIYAAAAVPERWPDALDAIAACFDCVGTALLLQRAGGGMSTIVSPALVEAAREYEAGAWKLDVFVARAVEHAFASGSADGCYTDRHLATPEEIEQHPFYTEFRRPHGLGPYLGTQLMPGGEMIAILTLQGPLSRATFSDEEIAAYSVLARHAQRSLMLTVRLLEAEARAEALANALSRLSCGVFALDANGRIVFTNATAERLVGNGVTVVDGRLVVDDAGRRSIEQAILSTSAGASAVTGDGLIDPVRPLVLSRSGDGDKLVLYFLPIGQELPWGVRETFTSSRLLVLAIAQPGEKPDPALIRDVLGLTNGEARLAALIGHGRTPKEAAAALGITEESARTVLKRVFVKTNTSRQAELATMLSRLLLKGPD